MWRRVYLAFPQRAQALQAVAELEQLGISRSRMHTLAKPGVELAGLPVANPAQRADRIWDWDRLLWKGSLLLFLLLSGAFLATLLEGADRAAVVMLILMVLVYLLGSHFAKAVPHVHLDELRVPLLHGEIVLMVDLPRQRVEEILQRIGQRHPELGVGGVGWIVTHAGI